MRLGLSLGLLVLTVGSSMGQDRPTFGQVVDTVENSSLTYECVLQGELLHCQFVQGRVSKSAAKSPADLDAEAGKLIETVTDEQCATIREIRDKVGATPQQLLLPPEAEAQDELRNIIAGYATFCDTRSAVAARAAVAAVEDKDRRTCRFSVYLFELDFRWNYQTGRWESVSSPQGTCGIVTAAFMEPDRELSGTPLWNYHQRKIATNKSAEDPILGKCSDYPDSELTSTWQGRELYPQCDYVKFSPF